MNINDKKEVNILPASEFPCKTCGSTSYVTKTVETKMPDKHHCRGCWTVSKTGKGKCKTCGDSDYSSYPGMVIPKSRFLCADCGAFRSSYIVAMDNVLTISMPNNKVVTVEFYEYRLKVIDRRHAHYVAVFNKHAAFAEVIKHLIPDNGKAPKESYTYKLHTIKNEAARKKVYPLFSKWWDTHVTPTQDVIAAQKRCFAMFGRLDENIVSSEYVWEDPYMVADMAKYNMACFMATEYDTLKYVYERDIDCANGCAEPFPKPSRWMDLINPGNKLSKAVRMTLINLPGGLTRKSVKSLLDSPALDFFMRPRLTRMEFLAWAYVSSNYQYLTNARPWAVTPILTANETQLKKAFRLYAEHIARAGGIEQRLDLRKFANITRFFGYLCDMDEPFNGTSISKFTEETIRWHREAHLRDGFKNCRRLRIEPSFPTMLPPIPIPIELPDTVEELYLIPTAGALEDPEKGEGALMHHCAWTYVEYACGLNPYKTSYIFHMNMKPVLVKGKGKVKDKWVIHQATAEVSGAGVVVQAFGPHNQKTEAAELLRSILTKWSVNWPKTFSGQYPIREAAWKTLVNKECSMEVTQELIDEVEYLKPHINYALVPDKLEITKETRRENRAMHLIDLDAEPEAEDPFFG